MSDETQQCEEKAKDPGWRLLKPAKTDLSQGRLVWRVLPDHMAWARETKVDLLDWLLFYGEGDVRIPFDLSYGQWSRAKLRAAVTERQEQRRAKNGTTVPFYEVHLTREEIETAKGVLDEDRGWDLSMLVEPRYTDGPDVEEIEKYVRARLEPGETYTLTVTLTNGRDHELQATYLMEWDPEHGLRARGTDLRQAWEDLEREYPSLTLFHDYYPDIETRLNLPGTFSLWGWKCEVSGFEDWLSCAKPGKWLSHSYAHVGAPTYLVTAPSEALLLVRAKWLVKALTSPTPEVPPSPWIWT